MFHLREGLFFSRLPDGRVRIVWQDNVLEVPEKEWASVVATVSKRGETFETWMEARRYHAAPDVVA